MQDTEQEVLTSREKKLWTAADFCGDTSISRISKKRRLNWC
jgi:hypothetical protein